jgi:hypothetical protein
MTSLGRRELQLILLVGAFVAFNLFLWSQPMSMGLLLAISLPLGVAAFAAFLWLVQRDS